MDVFRVAFVGGSFHILPLPRVGLRKNFCSYLFLTQVYLLPAAQSHHLPLATCFFIPPPAKKVPFPLPNHRFIWFGVSTRAAPSISLHQDFSVFLDAGDFLKRVG